VRDQAGIFFFTVTLLYFLAVLFEPYLYFPSRYIQYTFPLYFLIMIVVTLNTFFHTIGMECKGPLKLFVLLPLVILSPGKINGNTGYSVNASQHANLYHFISELPSNSMILGWPAGVVDNIPYLTRKKIYYGFENHHVFHKAYTAAMRDLAINTFDLYLSSDPLSLDKAIKKTNARYVLVEKKYLNEVCLSQYFRPFYSHIKNLAEKRHGRGAPFTLLTLERFAIYKEEEVILLDLKATIPTVEEENPS